MVASLGTRSHAWNTPDHASDCRQLPVQESGGQFGAIPPPGPLPTNVTGELDLTQAFGPLDNGTAATRGLVTVPSSVPYFSNASQVRLHGHTYYTLPCVLCIMPPWGLDEAYQVLQIA